MSQFYQGVTAGSLPPTVPTSVQTQNGTATPLANLLIVNGATSTQNNTNGIISKGGVVGTTVQNEVDVVLTNRITGSVTTSNATPTTLITFPYSTNTGPGTYIFEFKTVAYNQTDGLSAAYNTILSVRYDSTNGVLITPQDLFITEEGAMSAVDFTFSVASPNLVGTVTGLAGKTISWLSIGTYTFVS